VVRWGDGDGRDGEREVVEGGISFELRFSSISRARRELRLTLQMSWSMVMTCLK